VTGANYALELRLEIVALRKRCLDAEAELCARDERIAELEEEVEQLRRARERAELSYVVVRPDAVIAKAPLLLTAGKPEPELVSVSRRAGERAKAARRTE
jgi:hypothetical protein